jgi:hypothetical protein
MERLSAERSGAPFEANGKAIVVTIGDISYDRGAD